LKVDELTKKRLEDLVEKGEFSGKSEALRVALMEFLERRQLGKVRYLCAFTPQKDQIPHNLIERDRTL